MEPVLDDPNENDQTDTDQERDQTDTDRTDGEDSVTTPSQSRSPSVVPVDDNIDLFDGYSFKGRHSILIDSDEGEPSEDDEDDASLDDRGEGAPSVEGPLPLEEPEPKTPEAHQPVLPALPQPDTDITTTPMPTPIEPKAHAPAVDASVATPRTSIDKPAPVIAKPEAEKIIVIAAPVAADAKRSKPKTTRNPAARPTSKNPRVRREKSGVPALDRDLSDTVDEGGDATEKEEDDDWDFVEAADGEDRNGAQGPSLFARGVVDRYRLAVFRKASTPVPASARSVSSTSKVSDFEGAAGGDSPTPSDKQRRGRSGGLTFRKHPRQFLRPKSPNSKKSTTAKSLTHSTSASLSVSATSSPGLLSPSPSVNSVLPPSPSLKSKQSHISVGNHSASSDQSRKAEPIADSVVAARDTIKGLPVPSSSEEPEKTKSKKLKLKYKENAEKVLSLFASPRQQHS